MAIEPTPGRIVWYTAGVEDTRNRRFCSMPVQPLAAIVAYVHPTLVDAETGRDEYLVNLAVFDQIGNSVAMQNVRLAQPEDVADAATMDRLTDSGFCAWMPYQVGQAKKNEPADLTATVVPQAGAVPQPINPFPTNDGGPVNAAPTAADIAAWGAARAQPAPVDFTPAPADTPKTE